jgi:chloride channel protein, CIC family
MRAVAAGLVAGASALLLRAVITGLPRLVWPAGADLVQAVRLATPAWRIAIPVAGALVAGAILSLGARWSGTARGWDVLEAVVLRNGILPIRSTLVRVASAVVTQAAAAPVGREGPIVLLAATASSALGQRMGLRTRQTRIMVGCGVAAGLACAYNAPIGAALFAGEILFGSFALDVFAPMVVSSVTATALAWSTFGRAPVFTVPSLAMNSPWELVLHAVLGMLAGVVAALFLLALRASAALYARSRLPRPVAMASAALVVGVVTVWFPEVVGNGQNAIATLFQRQWTLGAVASVLIVRLIVTPLTVGSGAVGGVFTPTLFIGAMLGYAFGGLTAAVLPGAHSDPGVYALVGMACLLAGTTHAPLMATIMVFEMTLDYNAVVPLLLGGAVSALVASRLSRTSVYTEALARKEEADGDAASRAVSALRVGDLARTDQVVVPPDCRAPQLLETFVRVRRNHLYVVGADGRFLGAVNLHDLNGALRDIDDPDTLTADAVMRPRFSAVFPDELVPATLERFEQQECERLPVLADPASRQLLGTLSKRDILSAYARERLAQPGEKGPGPFSESGHS